MFLVGIVGLALSLWFATLLSGAGTGLWEKDWYCLYSAGRDFLANGEQGIYTRPCAEGYYWLYPPYVLYPYALASLLPAPLWYSLLVVQIIVVTAVALALLERSQDDPRDFKTIALFVVASAAFTSTVITGQHSAILLLAFAGALWALTLQRPIMAGLFLGLLTMKPNWAVVVIAWLLITRRWRALSVMSGIGLILMVSTLPLGLGVWIEYFEHVPRWIELFLDPVRGQPGYKLITIEAFLRTTLGGVFPSTVGIAWLGSIGLIGLATLLVWARARSVEDEIVFTTLVLIAANLYVEFYDTLVLAVPAVLWWVRPHSYTTAGWRTAGLAIAGIWVWQWLTLYSPLEIAWPSLTGGFLLIWIFVEGRRILSPSPAPPARAP